MKVSSGSESYCASCGRKRGPGDAFCAGCGRPRAGPAASRSGVLPSNAATYRRPAPAGGGCNPLPTLAILVVCVLVALNLEPIGMAVGPSCSLGVIGTAASVTVRGWTAPAFCHAILGSAQGSGDLALQARSAESAEPLICEFDRDGSRIAVRDQGALKLVGNGLCAVVSQIPKVEPAGPGALHGVQYFLVWLVLIVGCRG